MIHIACCIDNGFIPYCGILMISICENKGVEPVHFHIVTDGLEAKNEKALKDIAGKYGQEISIYKINKNDLKNCPIRVGDHISIAAYFRILLSQILPADVHKVLYLDCDIIVLKDLDELWNIGIEGDAIGAVLAMSAQNIRHYNRLDYDMKLEYFNSGVLLINLDYWRENDISLKVLKYINKNPEKLLYHDQDALNYVLKENKVNLPLKYNVQDGFYWRDPFIAKSHWEEMYAAAADPVILHYTGRLKPWYKECDHPKKNLYLQYMTLSQWRKIKHLKGMDRIRFIGRKIIIQLGLKRKNLVYR